MIQIFIDIIVTGTNHNALNILTVFVEQATFDAIDRFAKAKKSVVEFVRQLVIQTLQT